MNVPLFKKTRVELNGDTPTVAPLELQHLGLGEEYKRVVVRTAEDFREAKKRTMCLMFPLFVVAGAAIGIVLGVMPPSGVLLTGVMIMAVSLMVLGGFVARHWWREALDTAKERCEEFNQSPNMVGRAQFSIDSESFSLRDYNGKISTHTTYFMNIEYSLACPDPAMQPVAITMGLPAPGYPQHDPESGYPQHGPTPTAPPVPVDGYVQVESVY